VLARPARRLTWFSAALLLAAASSRLLAQAQQPTAASYGEQLSVSEALLDVVVTDRDGNAIAGLKPEDFRVRLDGKEVAATSATFYSSRRFLGTAGEAQSQGIGATQEPDERYFILFFHDLRSSGEGGLVAPQLDAARQAAAWAGRSLLARDRVAVVGYDVKLIVYQDFTSDRSAIAAAIAAAGIGDEPKVWPSRQGSIPGASFSLRSHLPSGTALRDATGRFQDAVRALADAVAPLRARKELLLFSPGFAEPGETGPYRPDPRYYPPMVQALNRANVAVYALPVPRQLGPALLDSLTDLAAQSGGRIFTEFASYAAPLAAIEREASGYYLLALPAPAGDGERYRRVTVECRNPELRATSRRGLGGGA